MIHNYKRFVVVANFCDIEIVPHVPSVLVDETRLVPSCLDIQMNHLNSKKVFFKEYTLNHIAYANGAIGVNSMN